jgi:molybdopterin synthase catalytic subunit
MNEIEMIAEQDFSIDELVRKMKKPEPCLGCIVSFLGVVRANETLKGMEIEIKDGTKAEKELERLKQEALEKFDVETVEIAHRKGSLEAGDNIVAILVGAKHRKELRGRGIFSKKATRYSERLKKVPDLMPQTSNLKPQTSRSPSSSPMQAWKCCECMAFSIS